MRLPRPSFGDASGCAKSEGRRNPSLGSAAPALLFSLLLILLVAATICGFSSRRFAAPAPISADAVGVDHQYALTLGVAGAAFVLAQLGLAAMIFFFRDRGARAHFIAGNLWIEALWTAVTAVFFIGLGVLGGKAWGAARFTPAPPGAIQIEVTENQFVFNFRYPGPDGKFGRLDPSLVSAATGNPLGIDPSDPAGNDDIVSPTLAVPVNRPVELLLRSQDVVHNFFVRELRLQQDAVPGMVIPLQFTADRTGQYEIVCTQLCGLGHNRMHSVLNVLPEAAYETFLRKQGANQ